MKYTRKNQKMKKIKLFDPNISKEEFIALKKSFDSRFWASGAGKGNVEKFENKFNSYIGSRECVAVNSGTAALHLALGLEDLRGKEVILPSLSFVSTAHAVMYNGGKPIFADIDPETLCINFESIEDKITSKTQVVLPVHFAGMPSNLNKIQKICNDNNLVMIEDAAHASGTSFKKNKIGTHGKTVCFSFHPVKNLSMPTGGAITVNGRNSKKLKEKLKSLRWCGISNRKNYEYDVKELGWNYYMNEFSAVIGLVQLKKLDHLNKKRKLIARKYEKGINIENKMPFSNSCSYHMYWIRVKNRKEFMKKLKAVNVETGIHYKPIHQMSLYKKSNKLPITETVSDEIVSIPIHPNLSNNEIDFIIESVNRFN